MPSFDRNGLVRPLLTALGTSSLLGLACGGAVAPGSEYDESWDMEGDGGSAQTGSVGGSANAGRGGSAGRSGAGTPGGSGGRAGSASMGAGGVAGTFGGEGGFAGAAGAISFAGSAGTGMAGSASTGMAGSAGAASMPEPGVCVNLDNGLAGLPDEAFPTDPDTARRFCGSEFVENMFYQMICLPQPGNGQSCSNFYPDNLVGLLYQCGLQSGASSVCGPGRPLIYSDGCIGNECCYVLSGACPR